MKYLSAMIFTTKKLHRLLLRRCVFGDESILLIKIFRERRETDICAPTTPFYYDRHRHSEAPSRQTSLVYLFCAGDYKIVNETFGSKPPQTRKYSLQYLRSAVIIVTILHLSITYNKLWNKCTVMSFITIPVLCVVFTIII